MINKIRSGLKPYSETFYLLFFLPMAGCVSLGISSDQITYRLIFALAILFLFLKFMVTDYSNKEYFLMAASMMLLGYVFFRTREKSLIISALAVYGCKDVPVRKVLKYTLWVYSIGMIIMIFLILTGQITGQIFTITKGGSKRRINDFGYSHPNSAYSHLLMIAIMIIAVWQNKLKWYHYVIMTVVMYGGYKVLYCRTGLLIYVMLCISIGIMKLIRQEKLKKVFFGLWCLMPLIVAIGSYVLPILYSQKLQFMEKLNSFVTGRIYLSLQTLQMTPFTWFGVLERPWVGSYYMDNAYLNVLLSYGWVVFMLAILAYTYMCFYHLKERQYYELIILSIISVYAFMEYAPVNATWNPLLLLMSESLFVRKKSTV